MKGFWHTYGREWVKGGRHCRRSRRVPGGARLRETIISVNPVQPLQYFVSLTFKNTPQNWNLWKSSATLTALCESDLQNNSQNYNLWKSCATLTALCEYDLQKQSVKLQFLKILCNPYVTLWVWPSKTHCKIPTSENPVQPLRHFVSLTFKNK